MRRGERKGGNSRELSDGGPLVRYLGMRISLSLGVGEVK